MRVLPRLIDTFLSSSKEEKGELVGNILVDLRQWPEQGVEVDILPLIRLASAD
jgi:hypothetical protein